MKSVLIFLLFIFIFLFCLHKIWDYDLWMHLKTGEYILKNKTFPTQDIYSYTKEGSFWANPHWLFQIIIFPVYKNFGAAGIIILKSIVIVLSFIILFRIGYKKENWFISFVFLFLVALATKDRFMERPEIFSYLFLAIYLLIIYRYRYNRTKFVFILPFLQILWTNIHIFSFGGIAIIFIFLFGEFISWKIKLPWNWNSIYTLKGRDFWRLFWVGLLCIFASIFNPYTYKIYFIPFQLFDFLSRHRELLMGGIQELMPPFVTVSFLGPGFLFYKLLVVVSFLTFLINWRRLNLANYFLYVIFLNFSLRAVRNIILFSLITMPLMLENSVYLWENLILLKKRPLVSFIHKGLVIGIVSWTLIVAFFSVEEFWHKSLYEHGKIERIFGFGELDTFPKEAIDFIIKENISGNVFNTFGWGGYFIYRCYPERKVFIDGRTGVYGDDFLRYYADAMFYEGGFRDLIERFNINYFFLDINTGGILKRIYYDPQWKLVFFDSQVAVFLKDIPQNKSIIERYGIDLAKYEETPPQLTKIAFLKKKPFLSDYFRKGIFFHMLGLDDKAEKAYRFALEINPDAADVHNNLGTIYQGRGEIDAAISAYKKAIELNKNLTNSYVNLGSIYQEKGMLDEAMRLYKEGSSIFKPYNPTVHNHLGNIYKEKGFFRHALSKYNRAIQIDPSHYEFYYNKGLVLAKMGRYIEAIISFQMAKELSPEVALIYNNIGACYMTLKKYDRAEEEFRRALDIEPTLAEAKDNLEKLKRLIEEERQR